MFCIVEQDVREEICRLKESGDRIERELKRVKFERAKNMQALQILEGRVAAREGIPLYKHCHHDSVEVKMFRGNPKPDYIQLIANTSWIPDGCYYFTPETDTQRVLYWFDTGCLETHLVERKTGAAFCFLCRKLSPDFFYIAKKFSLKASTREYDMEYGTYPVKWCKNCETNYMVTFQVNALANDAIMDFLCEIRKETVLPLLLCAHKKSPESFFYKDYLPLDMLKIVVDMVLYWGP